ncbi:MAG: T9SS type A sorting domain-containing protein, partial [Candidatus Latescibacteria bacterium]|nr:T9SS type A sorting domain-containing protein [Candidatus Latescibacterota bacterium]
INTVGDIGFEIDTETIDGVTTVVIHPDLDPLTDTLIPPGERLVCQLVYRVDETLLDGTVIPLHLDQIVMSDAFGNDLPTIGQDGSITVGERRGDLTHDGNINVRDLVLLIRILLGKDPYPAPGTSDFFVADANGDGAINVADAVYIINIILHRVSKPIADGPTSPVAVSLGDFQALESGQLVVPVTVQSDGVIAGMEVTLTFDPAQVQIGTLQPSERTSGMTLMGHVQDGTLRLVMYSISGQGIVAGDGPVFLVPVTVLNQSETSPTLMLSQGVRANHQAQVVPVTLGTNTVKVATLPTAFALKANRPNPFNPTTRIAYEVPQRAQITLAVYNLLGQEVVRLVEGVQTPGRYVVTWDGRNAQGQSIASGVYLYRLTTSAGFSQTHRMTLLK